MVLRRETLISWKVHSKEFQKDVTQILYWNRWLKQRQETSSNLGTYNTVFSVASTRILGTLVSAGGVVLGSPQKQSSGVGQLG